MYKEYVKGRCAYHYPATGLVAGTILDNLSAWSTIYKPKNFDTTLKLDQYHNEKLLSETDDDVLLGVFSVMYWGYLTSGNKSIIRCDWLAKGNAKNPKHCLMHLGRDHAIKAIRDSAEFLSRKKYADALTCIRRLPHVGVSFGTKYLAFIDPENVGILDDKIARHISSGSFSHVLDSTTIDALTKPKHETPKAAARRFEKYCISLNEIKVLLNDQCLMWEDQSGATLERFRAVDVERALFSIAKNTDRAG